MTSDKPTAAAPKRETVFFINLWPESGMKHYSESLVHALEPAVEIFYIRNYESRVRAGGWRVNLRPVQLGGLGTLWRLAREIRRQKPLAVHFNSELPVLLPLFPFLAFCNAVITLHDARPHEGESFSKRLFMGAHLWMLRFFVGKIVVHSAAIRDELPAFLQSRARLLPHVNYSLWASQKAGAPRQDGPLEVLFFGRLLPYKGLPYLLAAFEKLDPARFRLTIAGEGDLSTHRLEATNIRVLNHFINEEEMTALFNAAHVVALPYISASQSGVAYMAFAFEKPVIASCVGGIGDAVHDGVNGLLVEPASAVALARALEKMADEPFRRRLVETVRTQQLSADEDIRARLLAIYRE